LASQGVRRVVLSVGHLGDQIVDHVGDGRRFGVAVQYVVDGPTPMGTGGALRLARDFVDDRFAVEYGDTYLRAPFADIAAAFEASERLGLMTVYRNADQLEPSNVLIEDGEIIVYDKRRHDPRMHHIDFGLSFLRRDALELIPAGSPFDLATLFSVLVQRRQLAAFEVPERFYEIGTPESLAETDRFLSHRPAGRER
jgi:NDP-sugar pyrophosphorylase family protein